MLGYICLAAVGFLQLTADIVLFWAVARLRGDLEDTRWRLRRLEERAATAPALGHVTPRTG